MAPIDVASVRCDAGNHVSEMTGPPKFSHVPHIPFKKKLTYIKAARVLEDTPDTQRNRHETIMVVDAKSVTRRTP